MLCGTRRCVQFFSPRVAPRMAKRYRKHGLDNSARRMVEFLQQRGIEGARVLEIGGGIDEIQIEQLKRGAARAVNLELSPAYEEEAATLLRQTGLEGRAERRLHDIAAERDDLEPATSSSSIASSAANPTTNSFWKLPRLRPAIRRLQLPAANTISRLAVTAQQLIFTLQRKEFRTYGHRPRSSRG